LIIASLWREAVYRRGFRGWVPLNKLIYRKSAEHEDQSIIQNLWRRFSVRETWRVLFSRTDVLRPRLCYSGLDMARL